jgi:hypothetical protein
MEEIAAGKMKGSIPCNMSVEGGGASTEKIGPLPNPFVPSISKKEPACTYTYYALLASVMTGKAFIRKFSIRSVSQVKVL